eukprot:CAMPEP_0204520310 /NCGR_PEP_ID=MMETSP0661-20131031/5194_1 /ASSEMBLY_ACC=CAM_ASM_000606 /TAXON_ID=109239 /ORGANISM="Alexandrium margalefi, Strain AMGDE01CS-322" /LENGTH=374 /DNA_ID=CAMNT_0051525861 /DNA_START=54 /DNA_END=1174 /DNA_ORIENTATION=+
MPGATAPVAAPPAPAASPTMEAPLTSADYARKLGVCLVYIAVSTSLIRFNKMLMRDDHFPHALALSSIHTLITTFSCGSLYLATPWMLPAMEGTKGQRLGLMKWFVPIGLLFAVTLFGSNQAYRYCNVTFLQFMKEANVLIVFTISCLVGLQRCTRVRAFIIAWILTSASVSVSGEMHFAMMGFSCQLVSQLAECTRNVMGEQLLSGRKFDALTYNLFLAPICFVVLATALAFNWSPKILADFVDWWPILTMNGFLAVALNILVAAVIKECSAVGFVLCGLCKDIVIVVVSSTAFHEEVTSKQSGAFVVTLAGIFFWSLLRVNPQAWPVRMVEAMLCVPGVQANEQVALMQGKQPGGAVRPRRPGKRAGRTHAG